MTDRPRPTEIALPTEQKPGPPDTGDGPKKTKPSGPLPHQEAIAKMEALDGQTSNLGGPVPPKVTDGFKAIIADNEKQPQSPEDRATAFRGRQWLMQLQFESGDRKGTLQSALDFMSKYPEIKNNRDFLSDSGYFNFGADPAFMQAFKAPPAATAAAEKQLAGYTKLLPSDQKEVDTAVKQMDALAKQYPVQAGQDVPPALLQAYNDMVRSHESGPNQTQVDTHIAQEAREHLIEAMAKSGKDTKGLDALLKQSLDKYPDMSRIANFLSIAGSRNMMNDASFMASFKEAHGDEAQLKKVTHA